MEYIEREKVIDEIDKWLDSVGYVTVGKGLTSYGELIGCLEDTPTADVVEVRHGEWEFRNDGRYGQTRCYCSVCGKHSGIGGIRENQMKPYCPNCGARMDGGRNEQTNV